MRLLPDLDLRPHNTFGVAARAALAVRLHSAGQARDLLDDREAAGLERLILGGGSNVLLTGDWPGLVVLPEIRERGVLEQQSDYVDVVGGAGEPWDAFVRWTLGLGLSGLENLALIPGTVGAAPIQNIGAYGVELAEHLLWVEVFDWRSSATLLIDAAGCGLGYRNSIFKHELAGQLVTRVAFRLSRQPRLQLDYGEIRSELAELGIAKPTPRQVADAVSAIRRRKLPDPMQLGNAGSFFRNPMVTPALAKALQVREPGLPVYAAGDSVKLSAAWMIERCGWKGYREGDAGVAASHALVLVNHGNATGAEIAALAARIVASVEARFGVRLEPEVRVVGADAGAIIGSLCAGQPWLAERPEGHP